ncbi:MAG: hypothetical protein PGN14_00135, partial [Sphingomonas adhaesiva]
MVQMLAVEHRLQYLHRLDRAAIARRRCSVSPGMSEEMMLIFSRPPEMRSIVAIWRASCGGHVSPMRVAIRRMDLARQRRDRGGKRGGIDAERIARRQQDIVEPAGFRLHHDVAAMLPAGLQPRVGLAQELVIVVAQRENHAISQGLVTSVSLLFVSWPSFPRRQESIAAAGPTLGDHLREWIPA